MIHDRTPVDRVGRSTTVFDGRRGQAVCGGAKPPLSQVATGLKVVQSPSMAYPKDIPSANFVLCGDWEYWHSRGGVASRGVTHQQFLSKGVDEASDFLVEPRYRGCFELADHD